MEGSPDLYALVLRLRSARGQLAPEALGHGVHALFLDLMRQADPELSAQLHADAHTKPFTVAVLPANSPQSIELRATFTRPDLFPPLSRALLQQRGASLRLGSHALELADVFGTATHHPWAGYDTFASLAERANALPQITMQFLTPTAFGQGKRADGRSRLGLLPSPETMFASLAQRWNSLAPEARHLDSALIEAAAKETMVSRYRLESASMNLGKGPQKGFVGTCSYELPADPQQAQVLCVLADAAFYLGVGTKTARGMGLCRRLAERGSARMVNQYHRHH